MATVINNPASGGSNEGGDGMGFLVGVVLLIIFVVFLFYYGLPAIRSSIGGGVSPQINVPGKIDININGTK